MRTVTEVEVARKLASLSTREIVDALGLNRRSRFRAALVRLAARRASARLGRKLARFDALVGKDGIARAAEATLNKLGARFDVIGGLPDVGPVANGPVLVVTNHPGAFDALALMASIARRDTFLLANDREFLRAMPHVSKHLVFIPDGAVARAAAFRRARKLLAARAVLIHFGAGAIEPDVRFGDRELLLPSWPPGTGALALATVRAGGIVVPAFIAGVHSPRAKRLAIVRWAERRGVTTVAPLVQATLPGFDDVQVSIAFGAPLERRMLVSASTVIEQTAVVHAAVAALGQSISTRWNSSMDADQEGSAAPAREAASMSRARLG